MGFPKEGVALRGRHNRDGILVVGIPCLCPASY